MIKSLLFSICFLFLALCAVSQNVTFEWAKGINGYGPSSNSIAHDPSGNVYVAGHFLGLVVDLDPGPGTQTVSGSNAYANAFLMKLDATGNLLWAHAFSGTFWDQANSVATDASGNVYLTGFYETDTDFDPGPGTYTLGATGAFILKLDGAGNFTWARSIDGTSSNVWGRSIAVDALGNVYTAGTYPSSGATDYDPGPTTAILSNAGSGVYISKLNSAGSYVWAKTFSGATIANGNALSLDANNNVYLTGAFNGTLDADPDPAATHTVASSGASDIFVVKLDAAGFFTWAYTTGATGSDAGVNLTLDAAGDIYVTGSYMSTVDFDPGPAISTLSSAGLEDIFVLKLSSAGTFSFAKGMGGANSDFPAGIALDASSNIYTTGSFSTTSDFDPGAGTFNITALAMSDVFISKLDPAGNFAWAKSFRGTGNDGGSSIKINAGSIYTGGACSGTVDVDPGAATYSFAGDNAFIQKMSACTTIPANPASSGNFAGCAGQSSTLTAASGSASINWYSSPASTLAIGSGTAFLTTSTLTAGTYTFYAEASTCSVSPGKTPVTLTVHASPTLTFTSGDACFGETYTLTAIGALTYTYSTGSPVITPTVSDTYTISGTDGNGCSSSTLVLVNVGTKPSVTLTSTSPALTCAFEPVALKASGSLNDYTWSVGSSSVANVVFNPSVTTVYTVTGYDYYHVCEGKATYTQTVQDCTGLKANSEDSSASIYPNPSHGAFTFNLASDANITIINMLGNVIFTENKTERQFVLNLSDQANGVYFVKVMQNDRLTIFKIIKN